MASMFHLGKGSKTRIFTTMHRVLRTNHRDMKRVVYGSSSANQVSLTTLRCQIMPNNPPPHPSFISFEIFFSPPQSLLGYPSYQLY